MATFEASFNSLASPQKFDTFRHQTHGAEMSWVRNVLGPKCPYTVAELIQTVASVRFASAVYSCMSKHTCNLGYMKLVSVDVESCRRRPLSLFLTQNYMIIININFYTTTSIRFRFRRFPHENHK